ncbi:MAG: porin [Pseudomonadota bacterium]
MQKALHGIILALAASGAAAQTNVTLYGVADLGLVAEHGGLAGGVVKLTSGIANGSRIGFKGVEDLGGGMSALFVLEGGILADTGASGQGGLLFGRQAFVGLAGKPGTIRLGRQCTVIDATLGAIDPFYLGFAGRISNVLVAGYVSRVDNMALYSSRAVGGFSAEAAYGFGEVAGSASAKRHAGGALNYASGPVFLRLAHQDTNTLNAALAGGNAKNTVLGVVYAIGSVKVHAAYAVSKSRAAGVVGVDSHDAMLGATLPFGPHSVMASYVHRDDRRLANGDATQLALGYTYAMSKRTSLYAAFGHIDNRNTAFYTSGNATEPGSGNQAYNLGLRHTF